MAVGTIIGLSILGSIVGLALIGRIIVYRERRRDRQRLQYRSRYRMFS